MLSISTPETMPPRQTTRHSVQKDGAALLALFLFGISVRRLLTTLGAFSALGVPAMPQPGHERSEATAGAGARPRRAPLAARVLVPLSLLSSIGLLLYASNVDAFTLHVQREGVDVGSVQQQPDRAQQRERHEDASGERRPARSRARARGRLGPLVPWLGHRGDAEGAEGAEGGEQAPDADAEEEKSE